ncbi:MAG: hypothetical protein Q8O64_08365 [Sideroxyarcus sp.]|nr:hypothetical protein [Sideroxyarcus sp.]
MVLGLFGKKSDHPLAEIKSAQALLDDIPKNDSLKALQEISDWVETIREQADDFRLGHQWEVLRLYDQAAQVQLRKLLHDYFSPHPISQFQENRLWTLLDDYYTRSDSCHFDVLTRYCAGAKGAASIKEDVPLLCARGIHAITGQLKLAAARYAMVDPALWRRLADYYLLAEENDGLNTLLTLYVGTNTSVVQSFAVLALWYGNCAGSMSPLQEHIAERLFSALGGEAAVSSSYDGAGLFAFDLAQPTPPMRATGGATIHPALRFIAADGLRQQLAVLLKTLDKGILPEVLNFYGAKYEVELVRDVARRLLHSLTLPPPTRRNPRRKIKVNLKVANGFSKMLEHSDVGLNFEAEKCETWEIEDISATGFRSVIPEAGANGIRIGSLLGSQPEGVSHWGAGVVRRLSRDLEGNLHIGIELLSPRIVGVPLFDYANPDAAVQIGMYLNRPNDGSGEAWLLMKQDAFVINRSLKMELGGREYLLLPLALVEQGEDYDLARYRMMAQETRSED